MDTAKRIAAVRERLRAIQTEERRAELTGPSCRDCIFGPINGTGHGDCDHVAHLERRHDPVSGEWVESVAVTTGDARSEAGLCGPEGLLFQPYTPLRRIPKYLATAGGLRTAAGALFFGGALLLLSLAH